MDELRLAQLLDKDISKDKELEILKNLDVNCTISDKSSAFQRKAAFLGYNCVHLAVMKSDLKLTQKLLSLGATVLQQGTQDGKSPIRKAVDYVRNKLRTPVWKLMGVLQERPLINTLLSAQIKSNTPLNAKCKNGISHLHISCMFNHAQAVQYFARFNEPLDQAINADSNELPGYTPLHCAIRYSSSETAVILLTLGADMNLENAEGINAVCYLIERLLDANNNLRMTDDSYSYLCEKEIERLGSIVKVIVLKYRTDDSELVENTGLSAFHLACMLKDNWIMQSYIRSWDFKDINKPVTCKSKLWSGWTALHFAACCDIETFGLLLKNGADIRIKNAKGETAFDLCLRRYIPKVPLSYSSISIVLSDESTKLSDVMVAISKLNREYYRFLQKLKDINLSVPLESPFWPGYNLLHMSLSTYHKMNFPQVFHEETDYCSEIDRCIHLPSTPGMDFFYWRKFESSLKIGCSIYAKNADGLTPIHLAFQLDEWHALEELLIRAHENVVGPDNLSFLHIACAMGKKDVVEHLLELGADVNSPVTSSFERHKKPRSYSEMSNQSKLRKVLIRANSRPLHIAVIFKMEEVVEKLLRKYPEVHAEDEHGLTPLHLSLASTKRIAQLLLSRASNLRDVRREDGLSHLHVAAFADDENAVKKLLRDGADVNGFIKDTVPDCFATFAGKTPLHLAVEGKRAARVLIEEGADSLAENSTRSYETPLDLAMKELNSSESEFPFEKFKRNEIRIDALTASGLTTLHIACATFDLDWARKLLERGANPNARMKDGQGRANTPMHLVITKAISTRNIPGNFRLFLELLVEYGADVNVTNNCRTPLHLIANAYFEILRIDPSDDEAILLSIADWLLSNQISYVVNHTDADGFSYFHFACVTNNLVVIKNYLDNDVDVSHSMCPFADKNGGFTPIHFAIMHKNMDAVRLLLKHGADVRAEDKDGDTPLHLAILTNSIDLQLFDALLKKGADINAKNLRNKTPIVCLLRHKNITYEQFHFFMNRGSLIDVTERICDKQGIMGFAMGNTKPSNVQLVLETFIRFSNVKDAIKGGCLAIHNIVAVERSQHLTRDHYLNAIQRLTEEGSDIDEQHENGDRALDVAISYDNFGAIEALLLLGSNVNVIEVVHVGSSVVQAYCSSFYCEKLLPLRNHLWKMVLVKLDLNVSNQKVVKDAGWEPDNRAMQLYQSELEKIKYKKICQSLTANHFLSEWRGVIEYPTMSVTERKAVDNFFQQSDELREEFPEFAGLLMMQYRKALARVKLMQPVKDILVASGIDLPNVCLEAILKYFKNSELRFLIEEADEVSHPCKRRKIQ